MMANFISRFVTALVTSGALLTLIPCGTAQTPAPTTAAPVVARTDASAEERSREMKVLGIAELQPSLTPRNIGQPGNVNFDEAKANPYPKLPELLVMNDGTKVKTAAQWKKRREEIKAMFDENVYGKYPANIPKVTWTVDKVEEMIGLNSASTPLGWIPRSNSMSTGISTPTTPRNSAITSPPSTP